MNYYEQIRQACIKVNPSLIIEYHDPEGGLCADYLPITLSDVLMVLPENILIAPNGYFLKIVYGDTVTDIKYEWCGVQEEKTFTLYKFDLSKSVENQPIETLKFICENMLNNF